MTFFKSLIVFILIILILINIISISESARREKRLQKNNVYVFGYFLCTPCETKFKGKDITIKLYENEKHTETNLTADCRKYSFIHYLYSESPSKTGFYANFYYYCNQTLQQKSNVEAKYLTDFNNDYFYYFGIIDLKLPKIKT